MVATHAEAVKNRDAMDWRRPRLPSSYEGGGVAAAFIMFLVSIGVFVWPVFEGASYSRYGYDEPNGLAILMMYALAGPISFVFFLLGVAILAVTLILREIRLSAYEAAIRAGEVRIRS